MGGVRRPSAEEGREGGMGDGGWGVGRCWEVKVMLVGM